MEAPPLKQKAIELRQELFNLRFQKATGQLKATHELRRVKRSIAQVKTVLAWHRAQISSKGA